MIRTQIQLPDAVYEQARRLAETREISMAELLRRGLELILSQYPEPDKAIDDWQLPAPKKLGWRHVSEEELKNQARMTGLEDVLMRGDKKHARR